ncbi:MAG: CYTH domain-containing protein [Minisyncoccia bacterium]
MQTEWEATFWPIEKDDIRARLQDVGATLVRPERLMHRVNLYLPEGSTFKGFARVRNEGRKITLSVKDMSGTRIDEQKEAEIIVNNFKDAEELLRALGCRDKNYQETRREEWELDGVEICIDEWPFLEPFVEIEGDSEEQVRTSAKRLGFVWEEARFCSADRLYAERYGVPHSFINQGIPRLTFEMESPFKNK